MANPLDSLSSEQIAGLLAMLEANKAGNLGTRSPIPQQLRDLRPPMNEKGKLHRPSFSFSADADPLAPPYVHQEFPKLMFHARRGEIAVMNQEAMDELGDGWQETPIHNAKVTPYDAARAEFESLSEEDRALVMELQRDARIKRVQAALGSFSEAEIATLAASSPDAPVKRGPGRPKKSNGDGA